MSLIWPWALLLLLLGPLLVWVYRRRLRPPATAYALHPNLELLSRAAQGSRTWQRHLPAALYLAACLLALFALARPTMPVPEAHPQAAIVLALDASWSMRSPDIEPSRFEAAKQAVHAFLDDLPRGTRVGLVAFGYTAQLVTAPTDDHDRLRQAVDLITLQRGTAIGDALLASVAALPSLEDRQAASDDPKSLATVVLLSDGSNRAGIDPVDALEEIAGEEVTVHTVGVGSSDTNTDPTTRGLRRAYGFDETILRRIAQETGGDFVFVDSAARMNDVYRDLGRSLAWRMVPEEASALATLSAAVLLVLAIFLGERRRLL